MVDRVERQAFALMPMVQNPETVLDDARDRFDAWLESGPAVETDETRLHRLLLGVA